MNLINVNIDQQLIERVMKRYGFKTQRDAIDFALRRMDTEPMSREEILSMRGTGWSGDLEKLRSNYLADAVASQTLLETVEL